MSYSLAFDATAVRYPLWQAMAPLLVAAVVGLLVMRFPRLYVVRSRRGRVFGALLTVIGGAGAIFIWRASASQREQMVGALREGRFRVVEGVVTHFRPGSADSHPPEEFDVGSRHYRYAPAEWLYSFNHVAGAGGPVREGLRVRIADVNGRIARLEIAR